MDAMEHDLDRARMRVDLAEEGAKINVESREQL
jgi:hypothetical protein